MRSSYRIGALASEAGVAVSTLRYYERAGLLEPAGRTEGNYRVYGPEALERVRFIRIAQAAGFSLDDITALLDVRDGVTAPCHEVEHLIEHRLAEVQERLKNLREVDRHLKSLRALCRNSSDPARCKVLEELSSESSKSS